jgi:hypothetical protein
VETPVFLDVVNAVLNTVALVSLAYITAKYKNGGNGGSGGNTP